MSTTELTLEQAASQTLGLIEYEAIKRQIGLEARQSVTGTKVDASKLSKLVTRLMRERLGAETVFAMECEIVLNEALRQIAVNQKRLADEAKAAKERAEAEAVRLERERAEAERRAVRAVEKAVKAEALSKEQEAAARKAAQVAKAKREAAAQAEAEEAAAANLAAAEAEQRAAEQQAAAEKAAQVALVAVQAAEQADAQVEVAHAKQPRLVGSAMSVDQMAEFAEDLRVAANKGRSNVEGALIAWGNRNLHISLTQGDIRAIYPDELIDPSPEIIEALSAQASKHDRMARAFKAIVKVVA